MNYTLESFIDFCDGMEIAEEGTRTNAQDMWNKRGKKLVERFDYVRSLPLHNKVKAIAEYESLIKDAWAMKYEISNIPSENDKFLKKIIASLNTITIPTRKERPKKNAKPDDSRKVEYVVYEDELSRKAQTIIQKKIQLALNLIIHECEEDKKKIESPFTEVVD